MFSRCVTSIVFTLAWPPLLLVADVATVFQPVTTRSHVEKVLASRATYKVQVNGTVDMDNTTTRRYETFRIAFQNNRSLTVANTGKTVVKNPRVITNEKRRWWSIEAILNEILAGVEDDQEKALLIWDFVRRNRHHDDPIFADDELHDPVKMLNVFGAGLCDDSGYVGCSLLHHAGLSKEKFGETPSVRTLRGHMMCEAILDTGFQFLDIDENAFYLDLANQRPVSGDAIVRDHYLAKRDHTYGPIFKGWQIGEKAASLFGRDDGETFRAVAGHCIDFDLRPGEQIEYRWDNCGKFASDDRRGRRNRRFWGNSLWIYEPRLASERVTQDAQLATPDELVYQMATPYAICGGRVHASYRDKQNSDPRTIAVSLDGDTWQEVWRGDAASGSECKVETDKVISYKRGPAKYRYLVRITPGAESLVSLRIETDLMTSPHAMPRLAVGSNIVEYGADSSEPHEITITHRWRESDNITPPAPPQQPLAPEDGQTVTNTTVRFAWPEARETARYWIQVSRCQDMRLPYRPCFDVIIDRPEHESPFAGLFNPDETYYWRIRVGDRHGVWGNWSPVWQFQWRGPRVPVAVNHELHNREIFVSWEPNSSGPQPVRYEVYGSNERGFTPRKLPGEVLGLGQQPANFLTTTTKTRLLVVSPAGNKPGMNCAFYRIIAVDTAGVASGPSALIELPHPFLYSQPMRATTVGTPYQYQLKSLTCLGDLQYRYADPGCAFWETEGYEFQLAQGPDWLTLDQQTGLLTGTAGADDTGMHRVTIVCRRTYPQELKQDDYRSREFLKAEPEFHADAQQTFTLAVRPARGND